MGEGSIKGSVLTSRLAFVREQRGDAAVKAVLDRLSEEDRSMLTSVLLPSSWYPFATYERLDRAIADEMGMGDRVFRVLGENSAAHNLGAVHRGYVRRRDPHGLLTQTPAIYRIYYDTGRRTYEKVSETKAVLRTLESKTFSRTDCLTIVGWHERALAMCGAVRPRVTETKCRAQGHKLCEYVCEWS